MYLRTHFSVAELRETQRNRYDVVSMSSIACRLVFFFVFVGTFELQIPQNDLPRSAGTCDVIWLSRIKAKTGAFEWALQNGQRVNLDAEVPDDDASFFIFLIGCLQTFV